MKRLLFFVYGAVSYVLFVGVFLYAIGFIADLHVPRSIDTGVEAPVTRAVLIDVLLLSLFAISHSVMARPAFKSWWTKLVPVPIERSTYVLVSNLMFIVLYWQWLPIPAVIWSVESPGIYWTLKGILVGGFVIVLVSSFLIDHFDLFGLRQVILYLRGKEYTQKPFGTPGLYRYVRHPLYVGWLVAFWVTPVMTAGHLLFSIATTGYILVAIVFEERDLVRFLGQDYERYREQTPMLVPRPWKRDARHA